jgi:hypothetical protein
MKKNVLLVLFSLFITIASFAQIREVPEPVKNAFTAKYAAAQDVEYKDYLTGVNVHFRLGNERMIAKFDNKGGWKETEKDWNFDQFNPDIKDGFKKSKYAEWNIEEAAIVYARDGSEKYRVKVGKSDVQKKYLYFNENGRLVRDAITLK